MGKLAAISPAFGQLSLLKAEFAGAKSRWEFLLDRIINGYKDAYNLHNNALKAYKHIRDVHDQQEAAALMFIFSVVAVGFAGGFVGGLVAPWVRKAGEEIFKVGVRSGIQEMAKTAAKEVSAGAIRKLQDAVKEAPPTTSPYEPVTPQTFDLYLDKKEQFDECFARYDKLIDDLQMQANKEQWSIEEGTKIFRGFLKGCPVLRDKPDPDAVPDRDAVAKAAGLTMWVQWAEARDWTWWDKQYNRIDAGVGPVPSTYTPYQVQTDYWQYKDAVDYVEELAPVLAALHQLGVGRDVQGFARKPWKEVPGKGGVHGMITDLRKLRKLKLSAIPGLPFDKMTDLDFGKQSSLQFRGTFLDSVKDLRPAVAKKP